MSLGECFLIKANQEACPEDGTQTTGGQFYAAFPNMICSDPFQSGDTPWDCYAMFHGVATCDEVRDQIQQCPDARP